MKDMAAKKPKVTDSCGCVWCDLRFTTVNINDEPIHTFQGRRKDTGKLESILMPCTRK